MKSVEHIHQIWFQGARHCPDKYQDNREEWKRLHSSAQYHFWDERSIEALIREHYQFFWSEWNQIDKMIKKCDCARYMILHHYGGVYADVDTTPLRPIDSLLSKNGLCEAKIVLSEESGDPASWKSEVSKQILERTHLKRIIGNAILISEPGQGFWLEFLNKAFKRKFEKVLESFSTWHLTEFVDGLELEDLVVLPYRYLLGSNRSEVDAYALHAYDATWFDTSLDVPWEV